LLFHFARGYPKLILYEQDQNYVIQAQYDTFFYFLKRANSITRLGRHIRQPEKTGEELTPTIALKTSVKTSDAVRQILTEVPQARYNEGLLAEKVLRYLQPQGIAMQYDKSKHEITLKAPKSLMVAVLRHIETISRASRKLRSTLNFEGNSAVPMKREVEYEFSTHEWAVRSGYGWLPNTYVPMRD
jgi:type II secretory pathway component GspD/PulD (secretin)